MSDYATKLTPYSMLVIDGSSLLHFIMVKECYTCIRVGAVQFISQDKVWTVLCGV